MNKLRVCIYMMQRDEFELLPIFLKYYGMGFGYPNLHIFDNGSSARMAGIFDKFGSQGVNFYYQYSTRKHFNEKSKIFNKFMKKHRFQYDVFLPLDCDEFVGLRDERDNYSCNFEEISDYFASLNSGGFWVGSRLRNQASKIHSFYEYQGGRKLWFKDCDVEGLSLGAHRVKEPRRIRDSRLCYLELHNREFSAVRAAAVRKMTGRVASFEDADLLKYHGPGRHLIPYLLTNGEEHYHQNLQKQTWKQIPALQDAFTALDIDSPFKGSTD